MGNNGYAKFWRANKIHYQVHYSLCENGEYTNRPPLWKRSTIQVRVTNLPRLIIDPKHFLNSSIKVRYSDSSIPIFWSHNTSSKGSVVAEVQLTFSSKVSSDEAFADLKNQISDGNLGNLQVDPASLEQIYPTTQGIFPFLAIFSIKAKQLTLSAGGIYQTSYTWRFSGRAKP